MGGNRRPSVISRPTLVSEHSRPRIQQASMKWTGEKRENIKASLGTKCRAAAGYSMGLFLFVMESQGEKEESCYIHCITYPIPLFNSVCIFQIRPGFGEIAAYI